ncbi:MAG: DUF1934 domain-containing protein [Clostridia bacterium]|nr:DUF1934 domain-containing protein [Clostridia bacterium]MBQ4053871.1 DUF1934 domain-containing protein [Clostridia bacterium]
MQEVFLTIWAAVDQEESRFSCKAEMESSSLSAVLRYTQENARVVINVSETETRIAREGDYSMRLCLRENCRTQGTLSIGGNEGVLDVSTKRIAYTMTKNSLLLQLEYALHFGQEVQQMRLRIKATACKQ